ncbi:MAG: cobalamin-binding protein [Anaerolineaceae bacterium]
MKRTLFFTSIFVCLALLLGACGAAAPTATLTPLATSIPVATQTPTTAAITLTDGLQRSVTLAGPAQRVVSLAPSNTEILFAISAGVQVVGRDEFSDYPTEAKSLPSVGGSMSNYNLEAIAALHPDLVLAAQINTQDQVKAIENLGITVYYLANPTDLNGLYANLETVGELTGHSSDAATLVASLQQRVSKVEDALANVTQKPLVYYELDGTDPAKPWTPGPNTFLTQLVKLAGGRSVGEALTSDYAQISLEDLLVQNPDIILLGDAAYGTTAAQVMQRTGWSTLAAVKANKIYAFDDNLISRPGPRMIDGLEALAKLLHPEVFGQ